jgi:acetyl esterase/lipase
MRKSICIVIALIATQMSIAQTRPIHPATTPAGVRVIRNIPYVNGGKNSQSLDLYLPEKTHKPVPLIVAIHGGGWQAGDKSQFPGGGLVRAGFAVASINYRLTQQATWPAQIYDCKAAVRWLRAHAKEYKIDPHHVGAWGASAGGHLAALLGTGGDVKELEGDEGNLDQSSDVQAVCDFFGPTDLTKIKDEHVAGDALTHLFGGPLRDHPDQAKQASPITYVTKDDAPFLIMQGSKDPLVHPEQSQWLDEALKKAGVESHLVIVEGAGHGGPQFMTPERAKMILTFFDKHLKNLPTTKPTQ